MITITKDGEVRCPLSSNVNNCNKWIECETCCKDCPIDKLFLRVSKYYADKGIL